MSLFGKRSRDRWRFALGLMFLVVLTGVAGYMLLAKLSFLDALYQTIITITTTGYEDEADAMSGHDPAVKIFTIFLMIFGISAVAYAFSIFVSALVEGDLRQTIGTYRIKRRVRFMKNHYVVCGYGRMGNIIAAAMKEDHIPVVVVDKDPKKRPEIEDGGVVAVTGDATQDEVLIEAALLKAKGLIAVTNSDPENLFITMSARQLNPNLIIVSRALTEEVERKLLRAGANRVILPYKLGAHQIAQAALRPNVVDFIEIATGSSKLDMEIEEWLVRADSSLVNKPLREATLLRQLGIIVIGIRSYQSEEMMYNPPADTVIREKDTLIMLGKTEGLDQLRKQNRKG